MPLRQSSPPPLAAAPGVPARLAQRSVARLGPLLLCVLALTSGCAVALQFPEGPETALAASPARFAAPPVYVQTCSLSVNNPPVPWQEQFERVMQRDYGVTVSQGQPAPGEAHVRLRITLGRSRFSSGLAYASAVISVATVSIIPGYFGEEYPVQFAYAVHVPGLAAPVREVHYRYRYRYVLWLPFIVYPDFIAGIGGAYENLETKHRAWDLVTRRFAADLRTAAGNPAGSPGAPYEGALDEPCAALEE